ncbi:NUDIX hydrolase [Actinomadura vinacea]|uniref:NUDIX hydrolase n=1 Tax=Actinomadura vinacea TaxID=115336 RepID=A0ABN3JNJ3_9ACTN
MPAAEWYGSLPTLYMSASVILTDEDDRLLLVKQNYRDHWAFPGGMADEGEPPHETAVREVAEELGLDVRLGDLLVMGWLPADGERPRPIVTFMWDGGVVDDPARIRLQEEELDDARFYPWEDAAELLPALTAPRIPAAREARKRGRTIYLSAGA